jgi:hypothetical protein
MIWKRLRKVRNPEVEFWKDEASYWKLSNRTSMILIENYQGLLDERDDEIRCLKEQIEALESGRGHA